MADHVHVLARVGREISQSDWVKELKRVSSRWIKTQGSVFAGFQWQRGYGIFSVSPSNLDHVRAYVGAQEKHHARFDYQAELRTLLQRHGVEYDEGHLWD